MSAHNFQCLKCGLEFTVSKYSIAYPAGEAVYKTEGKFVECHECGSKEVEFIKEFNGFCTNFGKFSSSTPEEKREILKKRAKKHSDEKLSERKNHLDKNFTGKTKEVDFQTNA